MEKRLFFRAATAGLGKDKEGISPPSTLVPCYPYSVGGWVGGWMGDGCIPNSKFSGFHFFCRLEYIT